MEISRDRNGELSHQTISPYKRQTNDLETSSNIHSIYQASLTEEAQLLQEKFIEDVTFKYPKVRSLLMR